MYNKKFIFAAVLIWAALSSTSAWAKKLTILFTGDTQASFYHCDCPKFPDGGIARRATMLKQIRQQNPDGVLLLDSGGTMAGSIYDEHTQGEELDKIRTRIYLKAMQTMGYQAMAAGDDEFYLGLDFFKQMRSQVSFPFLSANLIDQTTGKPLLEPFIIKDVQGVKVAIVGLTSTAANSVFKRQGITNLNVEDPLQSLMQLIPQVKSLKPDLIVVLNHTGEAVARQILDGVPEVSLVINGHDWQSKENIVEVDNKLMLQSSFLGRRLGSVEIELDKDNKIQRLTPSFTRLSDEVPDDPDMQTLLDEYKAAEPQAKVTLDLFIMPSCIHAEEAKPVLADVMSKLYDRVIFNLYYIPQEAPPNPDTRFDAAQDEANRLLFLSKKAYSRFWPYVRCRKQDFPGASWERCAKGVALDVNAVKSTLEKLKGDGVLESNMAEARRLGINASPTLMINNKYYPGPMNELAIRKAICEQLPSSGGIKACTDLPECTSNQECEKKGYVGTCQDIGTPKAKCQYAKAEEFDLTVVYKPNTFTPHEDFLGYLTRTLPGAKVSKLSADSKEGQEMIKRYNIQRLPAYLFGQEALKIQQIEGLKDHLFLEQDKLLLDPGDSAANFYLNRQPIPGQICLIFSPLSPKASQILLNVREILVREQPQIDFKFVWLVGEDKQGNLLAPNGMPDTEECLRQLAIQMKYPRKFEQYLQQKNKFLYSSYWDQPLLDAGLDPQEIKKLAQSEEVRKEMGKYIQFLTGLEFPSDVQFLINNREMISLSNRQEFQNLIKYMEESKKDGAGALAP